MTLPTLYPAQVGSPYTALASEYSAGSATMDVVDASILPAASNIVCLAGASPGEFTYTGKSGNTLTGVVQVGGDDEGTWPAGTYAYRGVAAYDQNSQIEHTAAANTHIAATAAHGVSGDVVGTTDAQTVYNKTNRKSKILHIVTDLDTDHSCSGDILSGGTAGELLAFGDYAVQRSDGKFWKIDASYLGTVEGMAVVVVSESIAADATGDFLLSGLVRDDTWNYTEALKLFAATTPGTAAQSISLAGTQIIRELGSAVSADVISFKPSSAIYTEHLVSVLPINTATVDADEDRGFWTDKTFFEADYTHSGTITGWGTGSLVFSTLNANIRRSLPSEIGCITATCSISSISSDQIVRIPLQGLTGVMVLLFYNTGANRFNIGVYNYSTSSYVKANVDTGVALDTNPHTFGVEIVSKSMCYLLFDGARIGSSFSMASYTLSTFGFWSAISAGGVTATLVDATYAPSESYVDLFEEDTVTGANGRYAQVAGTLGYDESNQRMSLTAAAGGHAKGRLKSYPQLEGACLVQMTLPASATDGDAMIHYLGTRGSLATGYGAGVVRASGAWNVATVSGTTITDTGTPVTGLADGDTFYMRIERDVKHGVTYASVYETTQPSAPQVMIYNTYQEVYQAAWYYNAGAGEVTAYVEAIRDRARLIAGYTNIEQEISGYEFRDDMGANTANRYVQFGNGVVVSGGALTADGAGNGGSIVPVKMAAMTAIYKVNLASEKYIVISFAGKPIHYSAGIVSGGYNLLLMQGSTMALRYWNVSGFASFAATGASTVIEASTDYWVKIEYDPDAQTVTVSLSTDGTTYASEISEYTLNSTATTGYTGIAFETTGCTCGLIDVSGTMVEFKPMLRNEAFGSYHDGTQAVTCTRLIDDFQWSTLDEYPVHTLSRNTTQGGLYATTSDKDLVARSMYGNGVYEMEFDFGGVAHLAYMQIGCSAASGVGGSGTGFTIMASSVSNGIWIYSKPNTYLSTVSYTFSTTARYILRCTVLASVLTVELFDADTKARLTSLTRSMVVPAGYAGVNIGYNYGAVTPQARIHRYTINAVAADATNGIAAMIGGVPHGYAYGEAGGVYLPLVAGTDIDIGRFRVYPYVKSTNASATGLIESFALDASTDASASLENSDGDLACEILATTYAPKGAHRVKFDRGATVNVGIRRADPTDNSHAAAYVDSMHFRQAGVVA